MSYSAPYIDSEGLHVPSYDDIMDYLKGQYQSIFGEDIRLSAEMPDYQLLSIFAKAMSDTMAVLTDVYNSRNPNYATGDSLDILLALNGMRRRSASSSTVTLKLTGTPSTFVQAGSKAIDRDGNTWTIQKDCILEELEPAAEDETPVGEATVLAVCDTPGAIEAYAGDVNGIYTTTAGWTGVTNEEAADAGKDVETDAEARNRRNISVATSSTSTYEAMIAALYAINGTEYADVVVNSTNVNHTLGEDGDDVPAHTVCPIVYGGPNSDENTTWLKEVAAAVWRTKAPGIPTYDGPEVDGFVTVNHTDVQGHVTPICICVPTPIHVSVKLYLTTFELYDENRIVPIIKESIIDEINSLGVGKSWSVSMAYRDVYQAFSGEDLQFAITGVEGRKGQAEYGTVTVECLYNQILTCSEDDITIIVSNGG